MNMDTISIEQLIINKHEVSVSISYNEYDKTFTLYWNDMVVNEWSETFPTLSVALARLAALVACGETNWERGLLHSPSTFTQMAENFLSATI